MSSQEQKVAAGFNMFTSKEMDALEKAADGPMLGGLPIQGSAAVKAIGLEIAYKSTRRLRPIALQLLRPSPTIGYR